MALQMTCPFCHKEFPYDNGGLDRSITHLGQRINEIMLRLSEINALPAYMKTKQIKAEKKYLNIEMNRLRVELSEKKAIRKACDQQINRFKYDMFKVLFKEKYGEAAYKDMLNEVEKELQAYKISGLMAHEYTRSRSKKAVTSINKI